MRPLAGNQRVLTWFCVCKDDKSSVWQNFAHVLLTASIMFSLVFCLISSVFFVVRFALIDLEKSLYTLFPIAGVCGMIYTMIILITSRDKINAMLNGLSIIYKTRKKIEQFIDEIKHCIYSSKKNSFVRLDATQDSYQFLLNANEKSERMWPIYLKYVISGFLGILAANSVASVIIQQRKNQDFDVTYLFHAYKLV